MKKILLALCLISIKVQSSTYYIATSENGGNDLNAGTRSSPWLTLSNACQKVTLPGDTIYIRSGIYIETAQCILSQGVSIIGEGYSSHIISHYNNGSESFQNVLIYIFRG